MKTITMEEAIEIIQNDETFADFAFRGDNHTPAKHFRSSRYHGDDDNMPRQLPGVSAIWIPSHDEGHIRKSALLASAYGNNVFLLRGEQENTDGDYMEVVMLSHEIVAIVEIN